MEGDTLGVDSEDCSSKPWQAHLPAHTHGAITAPSPSVRHETYRTRTACSGTKEKPVDVDVYAYVYMYDIYLSPAVNIAQHSAGQDKIYKRLPQIGPFSNALGWILRPPPRVQTPSSRVAPAARISRIRAHFPVELNPNWLSSRQQIWPSPAQIWWNSAKDLVCCAWRHPRATDVSLTRR